jgi:hypothetical protein
MGRQGGGCPTPRSAQNPSTIDFLNEHLAKGAQLIAFAVDMSIATMQIALGAISPRGDKSHESQPHREFAALPIASHPR